MEPFKPPHGGGRKDPRFAAIKEDGLNYRLVESGGNIRQDILATENLPDASLGCTGFTHLGANCLDVIVVLGQEASQVLEHLNPLQYISMHGKLLP